MTIYSGDQSQSLRRFGGITFVVLLHVVIIYALLTGLGRQVVEILRAPIETRLIEEIKPPDRDLPPPPPDLAPPPPAFVPPPEIQIRQQPSPNAISAVTHDKPPEAPAPVVTAAAPQSVRVPPVIDAAKRCRLPEYPAASKRLEETGAVVLRFLIEKDGSVVESKIESSSGSPRLDEAARSALSLCHFKAGTVDGKPEQSWAKLRYVWKIE